MFGFDIAIITGAGPFLETHFKLGHLALGWAFSSLLFGCVLGSAVTGWIADRVGRRRPLLWVAVLFALTSICTGIAPTFTLFVISRLLGGSSVGGISVLAPMYVSEVSPAQIRGRMGTLYQLSIVTGILISFCINYLLYNTGEWNWRWMFISGAVPAIAFFLVVLRAPETPRYLVKIGDRAGAIAILTRIENEARALAECDQIDASLAHTEAPLTEMLRPGTRRALGVSFVLAILVHVSGVNTVIDYAPRIFQSAGWKIDVALFMTFIIGITSVLCTLVSFWIIDRFGRRPCYIVGSTAMAVALGLLIAADQVGQFSGLKILIIILAYLAFFMSCIGPVFWTLLPEMFPNRVRGACMTVPVLTQWLSNALVVLFSRGRSVISANQARSAFWASWQRCKHTLRGSSYLRPRDGRWKKLKHSGSVRGRTIQIMDAECDPARVQPPADLTAGAAARTEAITRRLFGFLPSGESIEAYKLTNRVGAALEVLTYGGIIRSLYLPDRNGLVGRYRSRVRGVVRLC